LEVSIDGVKYIPDTENSIGVAITTHDRPDTLKRALDAWKKYLPSNAILVVVDDASKIKVTNATYRFDKPVGVAIAKNKCIEILMKSGVQHLFLFDDDCWPKVSDWWKPYVNGKEPHYSHTFNLIEIYRDKNIVATHAVGGTMLYYKRDVIEDVGGMRTCFGTWGCEHVNLSDRIFNRGWTTFRYQDIPDAYDGKIFYECDRYEKGKHRSSATQQQIQNNRTIGRKLWLKMLGDNEFVPYTKPNNIILTDLYTKVKDPQRNVVTGLTANNILPLVKSIDTQLVVFTDIDKPPKIKNVVWVQSSCAIRLDFQRWVNVYHWLSEHYDIDNVWHVDGTDVIMTNSPWSFMDNRKLYVGSEQETLQSEWLKCTSKDKTIQKFVSENPTNTLLNAGLAGGTRQTIIDLSREIVHMWYDDQIDKIQSWETGLLGTDMSAFNYVCYTKFGDMLSYGPHVNNVFKSDKAEKHAWWKHK
jgi:hypothetical protein